MNPTRPRPSAFTLVEMLVVIVIIALLIGAVVAIGSQVRNNATRRATLAQLKVLDGAMKDYLEAGNPQPTVGTAGQWPYSTLSGLTYVVPTTTPSDMYNWVIALRSFGPSAKKIENMPTQKDNDIPHDPAYTGPVGFTLILDGYGTPIRYVPVDGSKPGYFMSAGPDAKFSTAVGATNLRSDEIYSYDPQ